MFFYKIVNCCCSNSCLLLLSINASILPVYCRIENYIHVVRSATFHLQLKNSRNVQLKTKKWKLWKAGVCQAMTEDVNGARGD